MPNSLKELRLKTKTPAKDMVAVVQTIYPKYDMTSQSKCENSDAYGICLTQKAMKLLYAKFDPDGSIRKHFRTADQHRLKDKLHARITADEASQLRFCQLRLQQLRHRLELRQTQRRGHPTDLLVCIPGRRKTRRSDLL